MSFRYRRYPVVTVVVIIIIIVIVDVIIVIVTIIISHLRLPSPPTLPKRLRPSPARLKATSYTLMLTIIMIMTVIMIMTIIMTMVTKRRLTIMILVISLMMAIM